MRTPCCRWGGRGGSLLGVLLPLAAIAVLALGASPALAAGTAAPAWSVRSAALPTNFSTEDTAPCEAREGCDSYVVTVTNVGTRPSVGPVVVKDRLPAGIVAVGSNIAKEHEPYGVSNEVDCGVVEPRLVTCGYGGGGVPPGSVIGVRIEVIATAEAAALGEATNSVEVEGGGAPAVASSVPGTVANTVNGAAAVFGVQDFAASVLGPEGATDVQAGAHPATVTTSIDYNTLPHRTGVEIEQYYAAQDPKMEIVDLPPGLIGDSLAAERCPASAIQATERFPEKCPADSRVGFVTIESQGGGEAVSTLYNAVPESGYPAEFGFEFDRGLVMLRPRLLPTEDGYVTSVAAPYLPRSEAFKVTGARVTFFGDPSEQDGGGGGEAFLTNPDACVAPPSRALVEMDSWVDPANWQSRETGMFEASATHAVSGCSMLQFEPSIKVSPETSETDTPSGYEVVLRVPQAPNVPGDLATPDLRDAVVDLPAGVSVSPGAAYGLVGCHASGPEGIELGDHDKLSDENKVQEGEEEGPDGLVHPAPGHCPAASQIGEVEVKTPLLASPLQGHVYVAQPTCGGEGQPACTEASATNGELYGLYLELAGSGVIVKLKGRVSANPITGQITTLFKENPQLPFSELKLRLNSGERAPLANPQGCGSFTTTSDLTPWSSPETPDAKPVSSFTVNGCATPAPFSPSFSAGSVSTAAASSSAVTTTLSRADGEVDLSEVSVTLPAGLVGFLSQVPLCEEPQAAAGECAASSLIGSTTVAVGAGPDPFWVSGKVYLTGPYNGAPFGLSVVVPAKAGPFDLGNVVVRAAITINPLTTAVTVTSSPLPQIKDGVPFRLRTLNVQVNRPGFILNPSNCDEQSVTGVVAAVGGATADVSSPFAVEGCKSLAFRPSFTASTQGKASKADGASLDVKVTYPAGGEANIKSVKTELPRMLPSRLSTLQKACTAAVFEANPATCPAESVVGTARASTSILPVTLSGPVYLVSHGGEKFPNIVVVLQGDGVRVDLIGDTDIKHGITSTTFARVPDDPVSSFELYLPEGKYSILGAYLPVNANYNFCGRRLTMPTVITGQNGAVIKQGTNISITGCPKVKKRKRAERPKKASGGGRLTIGRQRR